MAGNSNSGRRPAPASLRILRGNPGKRPIAPSLPVPSGEVVVPATISKGGGVVWARLAPIAIAMGTLTPADCESFKTLCELQATLDLASAAKDGPGFAAFTVVEDDDGAPAAAVIHAALKLEARLAPIIRPYYEKFGLEPSGRARLQVGVAAPASKWGALAGG